MNKAVQQQSQKQYQGISQRQIQAVNFLAMNSRDLREEIFKFAEENPALEIVSKGGRNHNKLDVGERYSSGYSSSEMADNFQLAMENEEDDSETLQQHLMGQLNVMRLSTDEYDLCQSLIYNLDKDGFYGSMRAPETLLDKTRIIQNKKMLERCISLIQRMDPVGVCCKNVEESLLVQAKLSENPSELGIFILDGNIDLLIPPIPEKVLAKLKKFSLEYHKKAFASEILLDKIELNLQTVSEAIHFIQHLNPHPAGQYRSDSMHFESNSPDIVLLVEKIPGKISQDDYAAGKIFIDNFNYFQISYISDSIPQVRLAKEMSFNKKIYEEAKAFYENLTYRQNTIILQGCEIVKNQKDFFLKGPGNLLPFTRRQVASALNIHESTVSRVSSKNSSKYIKTEWGDFPLSYFFVSGVKSNSGEEKISADVVKTKILEILEKSDGKLSDNALTAILNEEGIKIARRTVAKYRQQIGVSNCYERNKNL